MKKKVWLGVATLVLVMGIGTSVYAASADKDESFFEKMLPFAKQMHPDLSDTQIKDMVDNCQSGKGNGMTQMMNNSKGHSNMMNF